MKSLLSKIGLVLASLLLTLGALELSARIFRLGTGGFWEPHPEYGWRNIPGAHGWESCYGECTVEVRINSLGLRDREIPYEKEAGTARILFLGDSMTAGMQVPLEATFVKQLENALNEEAGTGHWEVINGAVNAFGTDNELIFYRLEASRYQPDVVVVGMYLANDIYNNSRTLELRTGGQGHKPYFVLESSGELVLQNYPVPNTDSIGIRFGTFLKKYFQLPRFVAQTLKLRGQLPPWIQAIVGLLSGNRGVRTGAETSGDEASYVSANTAATEPAASADQAPDQPQPSRRPATICDEELSPEIREAWDITRAVIRQLRLEVEASGARLAVLSIPASPQIIPPDDGVSWYCVRPNEDLNAFLEQEGIPYLDLLLPFREHILSGGEPLYFERDFHMNSAGHELTGLLLKEFIQNSFID